MPGHGGAAGGDWRDPRCSCGERGCPICSAPSHQPWTPQAGQPTARIAHMPSTEEIEAAMTAQRRWETRQSIRRYLLVLLLTGLGSMIGSAITLTFLLHYN